MTATVIITGHHRQYGIDRFKELPAKIVFIRGTREKPVPDYLKIDYTMESRSAKSPRSLPSRLKKQ